MKKKLINACNDDRSPDSLRSVLIRAQNILKNNPLVTIEMSSSSRSAKHYSEIYTKRLKQATRRGVELDGLVETTAIFACLEENAELFTAGTVIDERPIYFWFDKRSVVVGCVIG